MNCIANEIRSVGPRPNGGDAEGRGGVFPSAEGRLYGFKICQAV